MRKLLALNATNGLSDAAATSGYAANQSITQVVGDVISAILGLLGVLFLVLTVYAGMLWMTAQGDAKQIEKAKGILTSALIGLVITLSAYAISVFVTNELSYVINSSGSMDASAPSPWHEL